MEQVVLMNCALAAHRAGRWGPSARADGTQDAAPTGAKNHLLDADCCQESRCRSNLKCATENYHRRAMAA